MPMCAIQKYICMLTHNVILYEEPAEVISHQMKNVRAKGLSLFGTLLRWESCFLGLEHFGYQVSPMHFICTGLHRGISRTQFSELSSDLQVDIFPSTFSDQAFFFMGTPRGNSCRRGDPLVTHSSSVPSTTISSSQLLVGHLSTKCCRQMQYVQLVDRRVICRTICLLLKAFNYVIQEAVYVLDTYLARLYGVF